MRTSTTAGGVGGGLGEELDGCGGGRQGPAGIADCVRRSQQCPPAGKRIGVPKAMFICMCSNHRCLKKKS